MSLQRKINLRTAARAHRVRSRLNSAGSVRVSVHRSLNHIYVQIINDQEQKTLASCSTLELENIKGTKTEKAHAVGKKLAEKAKALGIEAGVFDRGSCLFHGRVKAIADGLKEGGFRI